MAVIGDLAPKFGGMMKKDTNFNSNKGVFFGIPISSQKFRTSEPRFAVKSIQSVMQVGLEKKKEILTDPNSSKGLLGFDVVSESELREKGFMGMRKTKLVCTVGPACCSLNDLEKLALGGMNVARLNMCHNTREWHMDVIRRIKKLNEEKGYCVSVMIDTEGSQIHVVDHGAPSSVKAEDGTIWLFTTEKFEGSRPFTVQANHEGFYEGIKIRTIFWEINDARKYYYFCTFEGVVNIIKPKFL